LKILDDLQVFRAARSLRPFEADGPLPVDSDAVLAFLSPDRPSDILLGRSFGFHYLRATRADEEAEGETLENAG